MGSECRGSVPDGRTNWKWVFIVVGYIIMTTLTAGHAWHNTCAPPTTDGGRWPCSAFMGAIWPVYLLSHIGIWVMDPATRMPTVKFNT
jgi:hypothetical protein